jgi:polyisoprenoid-binding protein YceI
MLGLCSNPHKGNRSRSAFCAAALKEKDRMKISALRSLALATALLAVPAFAHAQTEWKIDPAHSSVGFDVTHLGVTTVHGTFNKTDGTVMWDDADVSKSSVKAVIDVNSLDTGNAARDGHTKSDAFFDAAKFGTITFESTGVKSEGKDLKVMGNLTLKGVTKPVTLDVTNISPAVANPMKKGAFVRGLTATTVISRKYFNIAWSGAAAAVDGAIGNDVKVTIQLELDK